MGMGRPTAGMLVCLLLAGCGGTRGPGPARPDTATDPASPPVGVAAATVPSLPAASHAAPVDPASAATPSPTRSHWQSPGDGAPRIGAIQHGTMIWEEPVRDRQRLAIGRIRIGTTVKLKTGEPLAGQGCFGSWFEIEPFGYVCEDETTTRDFSTPYWRALASLAPHDGPLPYRYAYSMGAPMYHRLPTAEEQHKNEYWTYPKKRAFRALGTWAKTHEKLVVKDTDEGLIRPSDPVPEFFLGHESIPGSPYKSRAPKAKELPAGSGVAYAKAFEAAGRTWLLTPELLLVPADRVFAYAPSTFHGVELDDETRLPLAWIRGDAEPCRSGSTLEPTSERWPNKTHVLLTGARQRRADRTFWETREHDCWIEEHDGTAIVRPVDRLPGNLGGDERWIDARILTGYAVAYIGLKPVWTSLWSGGKGGVPVHGNDPKQFATTEVGIFTFQWKEKVATMSPDPGEPTVFWFADVPHVQYVRAPLALHVAYWHESFGQLMSAECLNFSPRDGEWLHAFTDPPLPPGWNAVRGSKLTGRASRIVIRPQ